MRTTLWPIACIIGMALIAGCTASTNDANNWQSPATAPTVDPANTELAAAQRNYNSYCAHCHGYVGDGQGAPSEERTLALGYKIVPRHDAQGHTWQHPDQLLFETIKYGVDSPLNLYPMVEYGSRLTDDDIWGIIDYLKRFWTNEQRAHQQRLTEEFAENRPEWRDIHLDEATETTSP